MEQKKLKKKKVKKDLGIDGLDLGIEKEFEAEDKLGDFPEFPIIPSANLQETRNPNILLDNLRGIAFYVVEDKENSKLIQLNK